MKTKIIICISALLLGIIVIIIVGKSWLTVPTPPPYQQGVGAKNSAELAFQTQRLSFVFFVVGWILVISGGLTATAGSVLGSVPLTDNNPSSIAILKSQRGLICTLTAIVLAGIGWQFIDRSTSATKTASIATSAIATATMDEDGEQDKAAYKACIEAKSEWLKGRMSNERLQNIVETMQKSAKTEN